MFVICLPIVTCCVKGWMCETPIWGICKFLFLKHENLIRVIYHIGSLVRNICSFSKFWTRCFALNVRETCVLFWSVYIAIIWNFVCVNLPCSMQMMSHLSSTLQCLSAKVLVEVLALNLESAVIKTLATHLELDLTQQEFQKSIGLVTER